MTKKGRIISVIFSAIDDVNQLLQKDHQLEKSMNTFLFTESGELDSLGLVNLIVAVEQRIEEEFGITITLADGKAMHQNNNPLKTIGTLADYIGLLLEKKING